MIGERVEVGAVRLQHALYGTQTGEALAVVLRG